MTIRILFLNYEYPPLGGGAANANAYLLEEYSQSPNITVDLITSSPDSKEHLSTLNANIRVHALPIGKTSATLHHQSQKELLVYSFKAYRYVEKLLQKNQYDVIHAFFGVPCGALAWRLGKKYQVPYIVSLRGSDVPGYSARFSFLYVFLTPLITAVWRHAKKVVANSEGLKNLALQSAPKQNISVIPNGVDTKKFAPQPSFSAEWIITAGATRLTERKGLHLIIEALPALLKIKPNLVFEVMGEGAAFEALQKLAAQRGVANHVRFLGRIDPEQTPKYYARARVFILPSANEGMSNALLEALASGLPVIVTNTGGSAELVTDGVNGFVITRDPEAIREATKRLLLDEPLRQKMGAASRARAEEQSWETVAEEYKKVYQEIQSQSRYGI